MVALKAKVLLSAGNQVCSSVRLRKVLKTVLAIGNTMNSGSGTPPALLHQCVTLPSSRQRQTPSISAHRFMQKGTFGDVGAHITQDTHPLAFPLTR